MEGNNTILTYQRKVAEPSNATMVELKTPKPEPVSASMASCKSPDRKGGSVQLKMPKLEPPGENNSPKCVLVSNLVNLASSSDDDLDNEKSESEDGEAASSDHSDRSDSDEDEYKVSTDDDDDEEEEEEEGRPRPDRAKKPKISSEGGVEVKSEDELPEEPVKKKARVKITPDRPDSWHSKSRNSNPGRRRVGGRIYDSVLGKTCHWCRQKTVELHVECARCPIRFCGPCLQNRNGENAELEILVRWICPKCRGGCGRGCKNCCNCGPCRKRQGLGPTGQLVNVARKCGFSNVHDYLVHQKTIESPEDIAARKKGRRWSRDSGARFRKSVLKKHAVKEEEDDEVKEEDEDAKVSSSEEEEENEVVEEAELYSARAKVSSSEEEEEEEENEVVEEAELFSAPAKVSSSEEEEEENEVVEEAELFSAPAKVIAEPVYIYEEPRKRKISDESRMGKVSDEPRTEKLSEDLRTSTSDRMTISACHISGSKSKRANSPVQTCISENPSEDIWLSQSSCETVSHGGNSTTEGTDFARELESALRRPFSTHQLKEMWEHVRFRKRVMKLRQTRSRAIEVPGHADGLSYLDHYPDLAEKLAKLTSPEGKLRLLRGFFFWLQRSCMEGAYRPWRDSPVVDDSGDCTEISGPDCEIIRVLLAIDEDEDNAPPEWEDKKPVITLSEVRKKFLSEKQPVPRFPVKVKKEEED